MNSRPGLAESNGQTKWSRCAMLAGAAIAAPFTAKATIIASIPGNITVTSTGAPQSYDLDIDGDTVKDFTFTADASISEVDVTPLGSNAYIGTGFYIPYPYDFGITSATPLSYGAPIGVAGPWMTATGKIQTGFGPWPSNGDPRYLGVQFDISGGTHYGWVQLSATVAGASNTTVTAAATNASFTLYQWAYQSDENTPINAGDTGSVPEPASILLFALGAAGIAAIRSRRKRSA